MVFEVLLAVGFLGFVGTTLLGVVRGGGARGHGGHGHAAHGVGHNGGAAHGVSHGHAGPGHAGHGTAAGHGAASGHAAHGTPSTQSAGHGTQGTAHGQAGHHASGQSAIQRTTETALATAHAPGTGIERGRNALSFLPSPLDLFGLSLGAGATGIIVQTYADIATASAAAVGGAIVFNFLIVRPLMGFVMRFSSTPSEGLEGTVAATAEALTKFDASGKGLVRLNLDGQVVQLLARLDSDEIGHGVDVHKGDTVVVTEVDAAKGTCTVCREMSP